MTLWHSKIVDHTKSSERKVRHRFCTLECFLCSFHWTIRSLSVHYRSKTLCPYVQAPYGRTSSDPNTVRADTLWTYAHRANAVRPKDSSQTKLTLYAFLLSFLRPPGIAYMQERPTPPAFIAFSECGQISKWKQKANNSCKKTRFRTTLMGSIFGN